MTRHMAFNANIPLSETDFTQKIKNYFVFKNQNNLIILLSSSTRSDTCWFELEWSSSSACRCDGGEGWLDRRNYQSLRKSSFLEVSTCIEYVNVLGLWSLHLQISLSSWAARINQAIIGFRITWISFRVHYKREG